ncbi:MAG: choice-of-anchor B family protein [Myxococcales bacterium]|nr:choice-of-anchor B family protein [Myxococcales bacterium]
MRRTILALLAVFLVGVAADCGDNKRPLHTIGDHIRAGARFSSLEGALRDTGLLDTLDGEGPYTLFAFTDTEFEPSDLPEDRLGELVAYHIHEGVLTTEDLRSVTAATTLEGTEIHVRNGLDGIRLNDGVLVDATPITADNGVIHVLDRALSRTLFTTTEHVESNPDLPIEFAVSSVITLDQTGFVHDLRVSVNVEQEDVSNLVVYLQHIETGRSLTLVSSPRTRLSNLDLTFADSASHDIVSDFALGDAPSAEAFPEAEYRAVEPLEYMVGEPVAGQWQISVYSFDNDDESAESHLHSWGMHLTIGEEMPAPALVLNPRRTVPSAFGQGFTETAIVESRRVGGLAGDIELSGQVGELQAEPTTVSAGEDLGALLFTVPDDEQPGARQVSVAARIGDVSRVANLTTTITAPQSDGVELLSHVPLPTLGATSHDGNDIWGWTDPMSGAEIALVGTSTNTAFVDVTVPTSPVMLGFLPTHSDPSPWRDIKVYQDHAFVVSEATDHGMQIFDLTLLRGATESQVFTATTNIDDFGNAHNIAINEDSATAYVVGSNYDGCNGGILVYDISTPTSPVAIQCFSDGVTNGQAGGPSYPTDVLTHDVQCVVYQGPDTDYQGSEICFSADEESIGVADFSDPANPSQIVRIRYDGVGYTHQGWLTEDHEFFIVNDEFDEFTLAIETRSYIWDMRDLDSPKLFGLVDNPSNAIGHNTYIAGDVAYQANYTSGLRLVDISSIEDGDSAEFAYYDTHPDDDTTCRFVDECGSQSFDGAWSSYPFFASGNIVVSDTARGLFVLRRTSE